MLKIISKFFIVNGFVSKFCEEFANKSFHFQKAFCQQVSRLCDLNFNPACPSFNILINDLTVEQANNTLSIFGIAL